MDYKLYDKDSLFKKYKKVRKFSERFASPLCTEDYTVQSMPDVSPTKWHLAHTSWFFEAFILSKYDKKYMSLHPQYNYLFNSYYVQLGERHCRPKRGLLSRPTVKEVYEYRKYVDERLEDFIDKISLTQFNELAHVIEIGIHHEQQHQELMVTDIKHVLAQNPLHPVYLNGQINGDLHTVPDLMWIPLDEGIYNIGSDGSQFHYDNEQPYHKTYINKSSLASRLITNREYLEFMNDGGYHKPELWLSDGWNLRETDNWQSPLYWEKKNSKWYNYTLSGFSEIIPEAPVCHISYYEADAYARWRDARLPTEFEWEIAASNIDIEGNFAENKKYGPVPLNSNGKNIHSAILQMFGDVWEWTSSAYSAYPGYKPLPGALGEYNGKFMSNQMVLRGGSCATSKMHIRKTYRNFFPPDARWQFMGIRLARDE